MAGKPYNFVFLVTLMWGTFMAMSASNPLIMWVGLEINMIAFLPLMNCKTSLYSSMIMMKYFVVQVISSAFILLSMLMINVNYNIFFIKTSIMLILFVKMGMAPYHFWLPPTMQSMNWKMCALISTWQKIAPLVIIMNMNLNNLLFYIMISLNLLISAFMGMQQNNYRPLLAYSSMSHISWCLIVASMSTSTMMFYFCIYSITNLFLMTHMSKNCIFNMYKNKKIFYAPQLIFIIILTTLSLAGLPPFIGFLPKMLVIQTIMSSLPLMSMLLIIASTINLSYYLAMTISMLNNLKNDNLKPLNLKPNAILFMTMSSIFFMYAMTFFN